MDSPDVKGAVYRASPAIFHDAFKANGDVVDNWLNVTAFVVVDKAGIRKKSVVLYVSTREKEGASKQTSYEYDPARAAAIAARLEDVLRIIRLWRNEGAGEAKDKDFAPAYGFTIALKRRVNDATIWWTVNNSKAAFSSHRLEDLSKFVSEFHAYLNWLQSIP